MATVTKQSGQDKMMALVLVALRNNTALVAPKMPCSFIEVFIIYCLKRTPIQDLIIGMDYELTTCTHVGFWMLTLAGKVLLATPCFRPKACV